MSNYYVPHFYRIDFVVIPSYIELPCCDCEVAIKLIGGALAANVIKSVIFNGKVSYRIVRADFVGDNSVLVLETLEINGNNEHVSIVFLEESLTSQLESLTLPELQKRDDDNISTITENKLCSYFESIEKRFIKTENHLTGVSSYKSTIEPGNVNHNFYTDMVKNRISELEKELSEKNAVIDFLTLQFIIKPLDTSTNKNISDNNNHQITNDNIKCNHHDTPMEKFNGKARKEVIIIGHSMLNNINIWGLSKSKKVGVLNFPGATSNNIVRKADDVLNQKPESLIVHVSTNELTNEINILNNIKKLSPKQNKNHPTLY